MEFDKFLHVFTILSLILSLILGLILSIFYIFNGADELTIVFISMGVVFSINTPALLLTIYYNVKEEGGIKID